MLVDIFKKIRKIISNMFTEDNLAAASIAQIFGSELLKVQNSAQTDSGQTPNIVNMDPKSFLIGKAQHNSNRKTEEHNLIQALQREAEASCPLPDHQYNASPPAQSLVVSQPNKIIQEGGVIPPINYVGNSTLDVWERIAISLEKIANAADKLDIKPKKKTIKRKLKSCKAVILNESNTQ